MLAKNTTDLVTKVKDLSILDFSLMSFLSFELKKRLSSYFTIDAFTVSDPFPIKDDLNYFIVVDNSNNNRIVAFIATIDNVDIAVLDSILGNELSRLELPPNDILSIKQQLMPKKTNNFYPLRKDRLTCRIHCICI